MRYEIREVSSKVAREIVKRFHYSGKVVANSKIHLGVFKNGELVGCLQYGPPMNGDMTSTKIHKSARMLELNRMVMADSEPRNSESQAISLCNKWIRQNTNIQYILSFSDGKEENVGYIYQATNWMYIGYLLSNSFYELDGNIVHSVTFWHRYKEKHPLRDTHTTNEILCETFNNVSVVSSKQHVYLMPLYKNIRFPFNKKPYPKRETEIPVVKRKILKDANGTYLPKGKIEVYTEEPLVSVF